MICCRFNMPKQHFSISSASSVTSPSITVLKTPKKEVDAWATMFSPALSAAKASFHGEQKKTLTTLPLIIPTTEELNRILGDDVVIGVRKGIFSSEAFEIIFNKKMDLQAIENTIQSVLLDGLKNPLKISESSFSATMCIPRDAYDIFHLNLNKILKMKNLTN